MSGAMFTRFWGFRKTSFTLFGATFSKSYKAVNVWRKLVSLTICVMCARPVIFDRDLNYKRFISMYEAIVVSGSYSACHTNSFSREEGGGHIWNFCACHSQSPKEHLLIYSEIGPRDRPEVLNLNGVRESGCFTGRASCQFGRTRLEKDRTNTVYPDIWSVGRIEGIAGHFKLASHYNCINENQDSRNLGPKKLLFMGGFVLVALGLMLLFKVLNYVYLDAGFNVNMALGGFFLAAVIFWAGGCLILVSIGFMT